jgi:hypothetical protein
MESTRWVFFGLPFNGLVKTIGVRAGRVRPLLKGKLVPRLNPYPSHELTEIFPRSLSILW